MKNMKTEIVDDLFPDLTDEEMYILAVARGIIRGKYKFHSHEAVGGVLSRGDDLEVNDMMLCLFQSTETGLFYGFHFHFDGRIRFDRHPRTVHPYKEVEVKCLDGETRIRISTDTSRKLRIWARPPEFEWIPNEDYTSYKKVMIDPGEFPFVNVFNNDGSKALPPK